MKITIQVDTNDSSGKFHPDCDRNLELLNRLGTMNEGAAACGVLRSLALRVPAEEFADLVEHGRLIVTQTVQEPIKTANRSSLERMD